jgi:hypothetical protein
MKTKLKKEQHNREDRQTTGGETRGDVANPGEDEIMFGVMMGLMIW